MTAVSALKGENVSRTGEVMSDGRDWLRPDLPIPLPPLAGIAVAFRRLVIGLREPAFGRAYRITCWWALAGVLLLLMSRTVITPKFAPFVTAAVLLIFGYVIVRVISLAVFQRQQAPFEERWIAAQSEVLRGHAFDVVRFTLRPDRTKADPSDSQHQVLNLADPHDVGRLMRQQRADRDGHGNSRADIEFAYWPGSGERAVIERVRRELKDIAVHPVEGTTRVRVRFPEARYGSQPVDPRSWQGGGTRTTYWFLGGSVRLTATAPERSAAGESRVGSSGVTGSGPGSAS